MQKSSIKGILPGEFKVQTVNVLPKELIEHFGRSSYWNCFD
jgi:hypothetical protein